MKNNLNAIDKALLEKFFQTEEGYVLDFSDARFSIHFAEIDVDIDHSKWRKFGNSKGKRLRCFLSEASNTEVSKLLYHSIDYIKGRQLTSNGGAFKDNLYTDDGFKNIILVAQKLSRSVGSIDIDNKKLTREFAVSQLNKMKEKISNGDVEGAIVNSRTLLEDVICKEIYPKISGMNLKSKGDLVADWKELSKKLNLHEESVADDSLKQVIRGLTSIINGIAAVSNKMSERHSQEYKPSLHHGLLVVNSCLTVVEFLYSTLEYQTYHNSNF